MTGGKAIHYFVIESDGTLSDKNGMLTDDLLHSLVGGDVEAIQPPNKDVVLFVNENGKALGLNANWIATSLARTRLRPGEFIVGPAVITGKADSDGDVRSLSVNTIAAIKQLMEDR